jgi:hypothetical protein
MARTQSNQQGQNPPRKAVQMQFDTRGSKHASNMTYDPQQNTTTITHHDGSTSTHFLPYSVAQRAGASGRVDDLIAHLKNGRSGDQFA